MTRFIHFAPQCVNLKKNSLPSCCGQVKLFLYQIIFIPVLLKVVKRCQAMEEGNGRESKETQPLYDQDWYNIMKSPGSFPCCLLTAIFLFMFDPFPVSWSWPPETLEVYSFTGQVMISRAQLDNHTVEEFPTLIPQYSTLIEDNKGM